MANYITIDCGTTNTRLNLVSNYKIIDTQKLSVGVRASINGISLKEEIKKGIEMLIERNRIQLSDINRILASGMITSEFGLCHLEHIMTPAGVDELNNTMYETVIEDVSNIPFVFIRGVKIIGSTLDECDTMRGEETELVGIIRKTKEKSVYILPGSNSKIIYTDENGKIVDFSTMLTGEMIYALSNGTILKDCVDLSISEFDKEYLVKGYKYCKEHGINNSLFKVRVLKILFNCDPIQIYSFFIGVILCGEIIRILESDAISVIVGGRIQIKNALTELLNELSNKKIISLSEEEVDESTTKGLIEIYELKHK